jgi:hypothetical protein
MDLPLRPNYRGGQLVVEYATVCFRSQEDCGPVAREHKSQNNFRIDRGNAINLCVFSGSFRRHTLSYKRPWVVLAHAAQTHVS